MQAGGVRRHALLVPPRRESSPRWHESEVDFKSMTPMFVEVHNVLSLVLVDHQACDPQVRTAQELRRRLLYVRLGRYNKPPCG